jgi:enoyl-CoA hydratase
VIELTRQDDVAVLTLRHGKANALDIELCDAIAAQFRELETATTRAVVVTGQGKMFSAGVDLVRLTAGGAPYVRRFLPALNRLYAAAFHHPKPVIAAINGHAIAGGCVLACCADRRIAARDGGRLGVTELLVGVPFPALAFEIMRFATPPAFFPEVILSGATYPPEMALAHRLVDEMVEPAELMGRAIAAAQNLAALPPATFAMTKRQIRQDVIDRLAAHGNRVEAEAEKVWTAPETLAHIADYVRRTFKKD